MSTGWSRPFLLGVIFVGYSKLVEDRAISRMLFVKLGEALALSN
jgi:hypothetical protein